MASGLFSCWAKPAMSAIGLSAWAREHLDAPLTVEDMAEQAGMSSRHFARAFIRAFGQPPQSLRRAARAG